MSSSTDMTRTKGRLTYKVMNLVYEFGTLTSYGETFSKSASTVPIVSLSYKDTFAVESSSSLDHSFDFIRVQPLVVDDASEDNTKWSNMRWFDEMTGLLDRWQAKTDGGELSFTPSEDNPYIPAFKHNGYIKSLTKKYVEGRNTELVCSLEFHVGTMYVNTIKGDDTYGSVKPKKKDEFLIMMSDANQTAWYPLMSRVTLPGEKTKEINCIRSYRIFGGIEVPFEHATFSIPRDRLAAIAPDLVKATNIVAGKNKIILDAVGRSAMYVSNVSLSNDNFKIDAYCEATVLKDKTLDIEYTDYPFNWIKRILGEGRYGVAFRDGVVGGNPGTFVYSYITKADGSKDPGDEITFKAGTNIWTILQICATYLGCKIFFANGNAYLMDYRKLKSGYRRVNSVNPAPVTNSEVQEVDLYTASKDNPVYKRTCGSISLGREGLDVVVNVQPVKCNGYNEKGEKIRFVYKDGRNQRSIDAFGVVEGNVIDTPGLVQGKDSSGKILNQADRFVTAYMDYRAEPQQSISFSLKEMQKNKSGVIEWAPFFEPTAAVGSIKSTVHSAVVSNISAFSEEGNPQRVPQKLTLSQFERKYPEGITTYYFGQVSTIDLSSSTSQINTNLNNL